VSPEPVNAERDRAASEAQTPDRCCMPRQGETKPRSRDRSRAIGVAVACRDIAHRTHHAAPDVRVHSGQCRPCASVVDETVPALTLAARITTITSDGREGGPQMHRWHPTASHIGAVARSSARHFHTFTLSLRCGGLREQMRKPVVTVCALDEGVRAALHPHRGVQAGPEPF